MRSRSNLKYPPPPVTGSSGSGSCAASAASAPPRSSVLELTPNTSPKITSRSRGTSRDHMVAGRPAYAQTTARRGRPPLATTRTTSGQPPLHYL
jgi:hypothetical protein